MKNSSSAPKPKPSAPTGPNWPSKTENPSGPNRDNNPPRPKK